MPQHSNNNRDSTPNRRGNSRKACRTTARSKRRPMLQPRHIAEAASNQSGSTIAWPGAHPRRILTSSVMAEAAPGKEAPQIAVEPDNSRHRTSCPPSPTVSPKQRGDTAGSPHGRAAPQRASWLHQHGLAGVIRRPGRRQRRHEHVFRAGSGDLPLTVGLLAEGVVQP